MSLKIIQKNIKSIVVSGAKLNLLIHTTAVLVAEHARPKADGGHGDCTSAKELINAMPASMRRTMLKLWFETYTPIRFAMTDGLCVKVKMLKDTERGYIPFDIEAGSLVPFSTLAEGNPEGKVMDFDAIIGLLSSLAKKIDKKVEEGSVKEEDIASARAASVAIAGLKLVRVNGRPVAPAVPAVEAPAVGALAVVDAALDELDLGLRVVNG